MVGGVAGPRGRDLGPARVRLTTSRIEDTTVIKQALRNVLGLAIVAAPLVMLGCDDPKPEAKAPESKPAAPAAPPAK